MAEPITRTGDERKLDTGVGAHVPQWCEVDGPCCDGSAPCSHPDVLTCTCCLDDWPCETVQLVAQILDSMIQDSVIQSPQGIVMRIATKAKNLREGVR